MKVLKITLKSLASLLLLLAAVLVLTEISPIYSFSDPKPFEGPEIYDPYADFNEGTVWKKANFHTHTHARKWFNECEFYPPYVDSVYRSLGYDIVTFSNHMELTDEGPVHVYEHGWNVCKMHNLVFNPGKVRYFDFFIPFLTSQKQYKIDRLCEGADFVFQNHPDRINTMDEDDMRLLTGYRLIEADCGFDEGSSHGEKWDAALSSGHYVPSAISDDLHRPRITGNVGRRCDFLCCASTEWKDIRKSLIYGCFYSMQIPDPLEGDWVAKRTLHMNLPKVNDIGLSGADTVRMTLSRPASRIEVIGQGGELLECVADTSAVSYLFKAQDHYVRLVARFSDGCILYSNPFARWSGHSPSCTPYYIAPHPVNWPLTVLFNAAVILISAFLVFCGRMIIFPYTASRHRHTASPFPDGRRRRSLFR